MTPFPSILGKTFAILTIINFTHSREIIEMDFESTLDCHRRTYTHKVTQSDADGKVCWDMVTVNSCRGRCDSNEVSDWRFPYKRSHHPVCIHGGRKVKTVILSNCEENVKAGTEVHKYMDALSCECAVCNSTEANCQGVRYRSEEDLLIFLRD